MTVNSATIGSEYFLDGLAKLQSRQLQTQKELSSGYRVSSAADDPAAAPQLVDLGASLAAAQTYQSNLGNLQAETSTADSAIGSAIGLLQSAQSLAARGASSTTSASDRATLAAQVKDIQQQLVGLADTSVAGRLIFAGDGDQSTRTIVNPAGQTVYQSLTAAAIFNPTTSNSFAALQNLQDALASNDPAGAASALSALGDATSWLNQQQAYYGSSEQRLATEQTSVGNQIAAIQTNIASLRDANIAQDATDLTQESTTQQAALAAQAAIPRKSLFDYLG